MQVEDDAHVQPLLARFLGEEYQIETVSKAEEVLPFLEQHPSVKVVVSDSVAAHLAGEVKARFRVPFLVYSGHAKQELAGVVEWIQKPNPILLQQKIAEVCQDE